MGRDRTCRLLCTGDLHLGRYPTRVPAGDPVLSVGHVWNAIVDYAVTQKVDAVVLTGDVADQDNRFFEAYGPLQRGLAQLARHDIPTFAVAGNHDHDVLPRLAEAVDSTHFHLLGSGGAWTTVPLVRDGETLLHFMGWSFTDRYADVSPLPVDLPLPTDAPTVGVVHGDLDQPTSRYAPLLRADLNAVPVAAWLLGHIHRPARHPHRDGCILYPGSPQPLDPGEEDLHGPWLLDVEADGRVAARQLPLATVRYATLDVNLEGIDDRDAFEGHVIQTIQQNVSAVTAEHEAVRRVVYRLRYVGRTALHRHVEALSERILTDLVVSADETSVNVDTVLVETRPAVDLEALARSDDPPGILARLLLGLERNTLTEGELDLVEQVGRELAAIHRDSTFLALRRPDGSDGPPDSDLARGLLARQGLLLLDELLAQKTDATTL